MFGARSDAVVRLVALHHPLSTPVVGRAALYRAAVEALRSP